MKRVFLFAWLVCLAPGSILVGCGSDGAGLDGKKQLSALDDVEATVLCADAKAVTTDCGGGITFTTRTATECVLQIKSLPDRCAGTVEDHELCLAGDPCISFLNSACAKAACTVSH